MATPVKPWKAEYAKSSRSSCRSCKSPIEKDRFRLGKMVASTHFDGFMPMWNHASCIFKKANQIKLVDDVEGFDLLRWDDQQKIRQYVESGSSAKASNSSTPVGECTVEVANSSRSTCKKCNEKILKGTVRISMKPQGQGAKGLAWYHVQCFFELSPAFAPEKLSGWENLSEQEKVDISTESRKVAAASKKESKVKTPGNKELALEEAPSKGTKRRKASEVESKVPRNGHDLTAGETSRKGNSNGVTDPNSTKALEGILEKQSKALWAIKDELKKHVTLAELRDMLEANEQDSRGSEYDLRERCADGMMFGALEKCPLCSGSLYYSGGQYSCHGYLSAWSKCTYATREPARAKKKWKIPEESSNEYLQKWFKSQPLRKPGRALPPPAKVPTNEAASSLSEQSSSGKLSGLKVGIVGDLNEALKGWRNKLDDAGVQVHLKIKKDTDCLVVAGVLENSNPEIKKARRLKIPIVREEYLSDCIRRQKRLPVDLYKVEWGREVAGGTVTVKVKGRSAVHEASGLQDSGHILEDGTSIYNTTMNMSDLSTGINSYYILQIIEEDKGSDCYVFRKWGRVGNEKIGGTKLEEMPKCDAIREFKRLFLEKTGNPWEAWEKKQNFEKQPGRFLPLDIDYGVKELPKKKDRSNEQSLLDPRVVSLMKMLFDIETYREAMMEFEINLSEMPLGKLSKMNIQKGFEVLTEIQNLLNGTNDSIANESLIVDASNRFFTLIPSIHPHVIRDEDDFKSKVKMLEALQDIEIASRLVGFDCDSDESLDEKYKKLQCDIVAIPHDGEDYKLVENYLLNTHAPTHKDWTLELEDVYALERQGEHDKYATYRDKLQNKMLLWHGSRLTNFVGILSQGLRIAPAEAPTTGYMFGKGIYFADLVSKSAQYCFVDKKNPVGLLLLSEVALGEMYELKKASYMDKPPRGKHSTKGLGKTVPLQSEYVKWRDDVVVPCGKPVNSSIRASELLYNEYIVYDTAQVKMQFLLKVKFHHKR